MANNHYWTIALTGGGLGALDAIDGTGLTDKDGATNIPAVGQVDFYTLDADSGLAEDSPKIIKPDTNAGDKRWIQRSQGVPQGTNTGDIIRYNAVTGNWESCAEPFEFDHIIFTPTDTPPTPVQGGMYFNLSENAVYVGVT